MFEEACKLSGREGIDATPPELKQQRDEKDTPTLELSGADIESAEDEVDIPDAPRSTIVACPEHSHPGESQSNGRAEAAVKNLVNQARTLKVALEIRLKRDRPFPCTHPAVA